MSVLATIDPANLQVEAGAATSLVVRVRNRGTIVDQFDITVVGPTAPWATVDPPSLRLFPDKEGEARVTFAPHRAPDPAADTYPFGIAVRAASDASASTVEEGHIVVAPFVQLASEIVPQTSRGSRSGSHDVTIQNVGNSVAEVSVKASDPDRLLNFEVIPDRAGLRPGGSATIRTRVKPKTTFWLGSPKRVPFAVQIDEPTAGSFQVPATLEQRAIIPGWIKPAGGLLIAAIAAVLVLPRMLGLDAKPTPTAAAVATATPVVTLAPTVAPTGPPPTAGPTPTPKLGPPDLLVAAGDKNGFETPMMSFVCPPKDPCRDGVKDRIITMLAGLQGKAQGARLISFTSTPSGTLPITATWKTWHYPYSAADGTKGDLTQVSIDLAPLLVGAPSYALVQDASGARFTFVIAKADAEALFRQLYDGAILAPQPTPPPDAGGGTIFLDSIYDRQIGGLDLQNFIFIQP
ncbi:MAG: hypothetical protein HYX55_11105 [Chloroflexi bacterium]|nr:hypothetical protein [Chloroflexota bacterium]